MTEPRQSERTAAEAGWRISRYNISAKEPITGKTILVNLLKGSCAEYSPAILYLMSALDEIGEDHPIINLLANRGAICNFDELAAIEASSRAPNLGARGVGLVICPTMGCNFDCPYCFEEHRRGKMRPEVQEDVVALAERMIDANVAESLRVTWFGGEPLLAPDVVESLSERLISLANERHIEYSAGVITNGYLLDQDMVDMLARCKVDAVQITLDGLGATHDETRHLVGGGPTFERIVSNLRECDIPFHVHVRHNVHEGNRLEAGELESFVERLAAESNNEMNYFAARVVDSEPATRRGGGALAPCGSAAAEIAVAVDAERFGPGRALFCGANSMEGVAVDSHGSLYQCWEIVGNRQYSFGTASDWDPTNPFTTVENVDMLTCYMNAFGAACDAECRECVWLPHCAGGCPHKRLFGSGRQCVPYRDDPASYVLEVWKRHQTPSGDLIPSPSACGRAAPAGR